MHTHTLLALSLSKTDKATGREEREGAPGIPMPYVPRSPRPRMRSPSVMTTTSTLSLGQLSSTCFTLPLSVMDTYMPLLVLVVSGKSSVGV